MFFLDLESLLADRDREKTFELFSPAFLPLPGIASSVDLRSRQQPEQDSLPESGMAKKVAKRRSFQWIFPEIFLQIFPEIVTEAILVVSGRLHPVLLLLVSAWATSPQFQ